MSRSRPEEWPRQVLPAVLDVVTEQVVFVLDPEGRVTSWNDGARQIIGYEADEIIGRSSSFLYPDGDVARGEPERVLEEAQELGRFEGEGWRTRKDGSRFWARVVVIPVLDEAGEVAGFIQGTHDATQRKRATDLLAATDAIAGAVLAGQPAGDVIAQVATHARLLAGAPVAVVVTAEPAGGVVVTEASDGPGPGPVRTRSARPGSLAERLLNEPGPATDGGWLADGGVRDELGGELGLRLAVLAPLGDGARPAGILGVGHRDGSRPPAAESHAIDAFARCAGVAVECATLRHTDRGLAVAMDRERIARTIRTGVVHRLFQVGLGLQALATSAEGTETGRRLAREVGELDAVIRELRQAIFVGAR